MLSVVIAAFEGAARLRLTLRSIIAAARHDGVLAEIVVVNDGSTRSVGEVVRQAAVSCDAVVEVCTVHRGRSAARNAGAYSAHGDRLLFLDADVLATRGLLASHLRYGADRPAALVRGTIVHLPWLAALEDPSTGLLTRNARRALGVANGETSALESRRLELDPDGLPGQRVHTIARTRRFERDLHTWLRSRPLDARGRWIGSTGANLGLSRVNFERLGGFDERMGLRWGAEDLEFGYRCEKAGLSLVHAPNAVVYHMDHPAAPDRSLHHRRALTYFAQKHRDAAVLNLQGYFFGSASLAEVLEA